LGLFGAEYAKVPIKRHAVTLAQQQKQCRSDHHNLGLFPAVVDAYRRRSVVRREHVIYLLHIFGSRGMD
jgi:hypothetical protein